MARLFLSLSLPLCNTPSPNCQLASKVPSGCATTLRPKSSYAARYLAALSSSTSYYLALDLLARRSPCVLPLVRARAAPSRRGWVRGRRHLARAPGVALAEMLPLRNHWSTSRDARAGSAETLAGRNSEQDTWPRRASMSGGRQQRPQEPAEGGEEDVGAFGADRADDREAGSPSQRTAGPEGRVHRPW